MAPVATIWQPVALTVHKRFGAHHRRAGGICQPSDGDWQARMLATACKDGDAAVVRRLLEADIPVLLSNQDDNCRTVLHHVTRPVNWGYWENAEILKILIEKGASASAEDVKGKSALDYALEGGSGRLANILQEFRNVPAKERQESCRNRVIFDYLYFKILLTIN